MPRSERLTMRDILDGLLESADGVMLGRVADAEIAVEQDTARITAVITGPEALSSRVGTRLGPLFHRLLHGRFEHRIPIDEIEEFGPTLKLRQNADQYTIGHADDWIFTHILRFIPGSGSR